MSASASVSKRGDMMYKIVYQDMIIDVVEKPKYCKYIERANRTVLCDKTSANCIVSSDGSQVYHIAGTLAMPDTYKSVKILKINKQEFDKARRLLLATMSRNIK